VTIEDKLRDAFRADGESVRPETIRPLGARLGNHPDSDRPLRPRRLTIPLLAAAGVAVIALGASVAVPKLLPADVVKHRLGPASRAASTGIPAARFPLAARSLAGGYPDGRLPADPMPRYFVGITYPGRKPATEYAFTVAVYSSATGKIVARLSPPEPGRYFQAVAAIGDDNTFVAAATPGFPRPGDCRTWLYEFRLTASGTPTGLTPLAVPEVTGWASQSSLAGSGNGSLITYSTYGCTRTGGGSTGPYTLGEIDLRTRKSRSWSNPEVAAIRGAGSPEDYQFSGLPALSDGGLFSFVRGGNITSMAALLVRLTEPAVEVRRVLTSPGTGGVLATALSPNARVTFALTVRRPTYPYTIQLGAYDTATGQLLRTWDAASHQGIGSELMTADPSGGHLLVAGFPDPLNQITVVSVATGEAATLSLTQASMPLDIAW